MSGLNIPWFAFGMASERLLSWAIREIETRHPSATEPGTFSTTELIGVGIPFVTVGALLLLGNEVSASEPGDTPESAEAKLREKLEKYGSLVAGIGTAGIIAYTIPKITGGTDLTSLSQSLVSTLASLH